MNIIKKIVEGIRLRDMKKDAERVNEDYQISERAGQLWLTFWGHPILPQELLKEDIVKTLIQIRKLHMGEKL